MFEPATIKLLSAVLKIKLSRFSKLKEKSFKYNYDKINPSYGPNETFTSAPLSNNSLTASMKSLRMASDSTGVPSTCFVFALAPDSGCIVRNAE
jgi:hypothetical protein